MRSQQSPNTRRSGKPPAANNPICGKLGSRDPRYGRASFGFPRGRNAARDPQRRPFIPYAADRRTNVAEHSVLQTAGAGIKLSLSTTSPVPVQQRANFFMR
jgi:hypothetical protein